MRPYAILLFIISVIASLGAVSYYFPEEGIDIKGVNVRFASIQDVLGEEDVEVAEPEISPEELMEIRKKEILAAQKDSIETFFHNSPIRFHFPEDDITFFDSLFAALEGADSTKIRIVHYGDSQIEEDRITGVIRDSLQKHFGGDGQGMMPARRHFTFSTGADSSAELERYMVFANKAGNNRYGPYGDFTRLYGSTRLTYYPSGRKDVERKTFNEVTVLAGNTSGNGLRISYGDKTVEFPAGRNYVRAVFDVPDSSQRVSINISGTGDLYGVLMDNNTGVSMDNVPMRGCSGTIFTSMNSDQLRRFYDEENVRLIFLQYGGNRMPIITKTEHISKFCETTRRQIEHIQSLAPEAKIVYIGPSDMAKSIKGKMQTYPMLPELIDSLKYTATSSGAAYWDIYSAMGGKNSMAAWVKARPALAASDHVHFTTKGAKSIGNMFFESFKLYYDYFTWRRENEQ